MPTSSSRIPVVVFKGIFFFPVINLSVTFVLRERMEVCEAFRVNSVMHHVRINYISRR